MTQRIDFKKQLDSYRAGHHKFRIIEVPTLQYLMVDGHGDPNTSREFADAMAALYPVAYKLKFASKQDLGKDYVVMPLEGLWWAGNMETFTSLRDKSRWDWTLMIMVPDWITRDMFIAAVTRVAAGGKPASLDKLRLQALEEGTCVQTLHIGSYDDEADILDQMHHQFIPEHGFRMAGKHHEIYFSDFRKVAPDKLRTILRHPVIAA
jgi:hypothetical protein